MKTKINYLTKKAAIEYLKIPAKHFENYVKNSKEIKGRKIKKRWHFDIEKLKEWNRQKKYGTVAITKNEYQSAFEFAIKMAYSNNASHGTGIRGTRSEMQRADDFITGIIAETGFKKFLKSRLSTNIKLDSKVHPEKITPQDVVKIKKNGKWYDPKINIAVKSSKMKSCFNVIDPLEYENDDRKSDIYVFARVDIPSDHLFRVLRNEKIFKKVRKYLDSHKSFKKINELGEIKVWICGYNYPQEFKKRKSIPGQKFSGRRYVSSTANMRKNENEWNKLIKKIKV